MSERNWSEQQNAIFGWFKGGKGNLVVTARAGTGKTTTIIEGIAHAPEDNILLCAFNKSIAEELSRKLKNPKATAKTLHSVGFSFVLRNWSGVKVDNDRGWRLAAASAGEHNPPDPMVTLIARTASLGKGSVPSGDVDKLIDLVYAFDLEPDDQWQEEGWTAERIARCASSAMTLAATDRDGTIDFDDMIFLPVRNRWAQGRFDLVVVDEAQDMNTAQLELAQMVTKRGGRIAVVGDDRQAIYAFRGADSDSIARLSKELNATDLKLTITYRCPKLVVAQAQRLVPDYEAALSAPDGEIQTMGIEQMYGAAAIGDFVLSRKNAPLAKICLTMLRAGKPARIQGRDVGKGILALVRKLGARSIPELFTKLAAWETKTVKRLTEQKRKSAQARIEEVTDQAALIRELAEGLSGPAELTARIEQIFSDNNIASTIVLSSIHRIKGLEAERVFVLTNTLYCGGKRTGREEENLEYVAITRAKGTLVLVEGKV